MNPFTFTAACLLLATVPHSDVLRDEVEVMETNNFHDGDAQLIFSQLLFWDGEHIRDWRLLKNRSDMPERSITIRRDYQRGGYVARWDEDGVLREVRAACWRESWTQYDPELIDRDKLPVCKRRKLTTREGWKP